MIEADLAIRLVASGDLLGVLRTVPSHAIDPTYLAYRRERHRHTYVDPTHMFTELIRLFRVGRADPDEIGGGPDDSR